jgi:DNA-binding NarL/FixJ family response regulator
LINIVVVDDNKVTCIGIRRSVDQATNFKVIGEAEDAREAAELCSSLEPDTILMDACMPFLNGIRGTENIISQILSTKIIIITGSGNSHKTQALMSSGAKGYCLKEIDSADLVNGIRQVREDDTGSDSSITNPGSKSRDLNSDRFGLSSRELQVTDLIVEGRTNKEIGLKLHLSANTIKSHLKTIMGKLSCTDRTQLAVKAVREKLI